MCAVKKMAHTTRNLDNLLVSPKKDPIAMAIGLPPTNKQQARGPESKG